MRKCISFLDNRKIGVSIRIRNRFHIVSSGDIHVNRITIHDIAQLAGVGKATVSRVLNDSGYVSDETRHKVTRVIREQTYIPSATARNLSLQASDTIGVIVPEADNPFFAEILKGISGAVNSRNLTLLFCNTDNSMEKDIKSLQIMCRQQVKGLVYTPAVDYGQINKCSVIHQMLKDLRCPAVILDRPLGDLDFDGVFSDDFGGAYVATKALIDAGHKRIGIIAGDLELSIGRERLRGFNAAMTDSGLSVEDDDVLYARFSAEESYQRTRRMLEDQAFPTAFFAANNLNAYGFLKAVFEKGMRIPHDLGFVSFDRLGNLHDLGFRFSYLDRDVIGMGAEAVRLLMERIENNVVRSGRVIFPSRLVLLGSEKLH